MSHSILPPTMSPKNRINGGTISLEVSHTSTSVTTTTRTGTGAPQSAAPSRDTFTPGRAMPDEGSFYYGPLRTIVPKPGENRIQHQPANYGQTTFQYESMSLKSIFSAQKQGEGMTAETYHSIEITLTKISIQWGGGCQKPEQKPEGGYESKVSGTAYNVTNFMKTEEGKAELAKIQEVQESFNAVRENWAANSFETESDLAKMRLDDAQIEWVTKLRDEDPAGFRAWLQIHVGPNAVNGDFDRCIKPEDFTLEDYNAWMCQSITDYANGAEPVEGAAPSTDTGVIGAMKTAENFTPPTSQEFLNGILQQQQSKKEVDWSEILTFCEPEETTGTEAASSDKAQQSYYDHTEDIQELVKQFQDTLRKMEQGIKAIPDWWETTTMPVEPKRIEGESSEKFQLRQISYEVSYSWKDSLIQWSKHTQNWTMGEAQRYLKEQSTAWVTDLMESSPAHFRTWLERTMKDDVENGWYDTNGNFTVATVPKGFTVSDYNEWMSKGVLDYL